MDTAIASQRGSLYRSLVMRIAYLAQDRGDLQYATKELARGMSEPTEWYWSQLKRLGRYLLGRPRVELVYKWQKYTNHLNCFVDSDFAGCKRTRKSTNGGALVHGSHCLKTWSSNQAVIALSSGEAEFYAMVKGASELLGMLSLAQDLRVPLKGHLHSDSSAAIGISSRRGLGKVKHMHTQYLWIQERIRAGDFSVHKENTDNNVADLFTKHLAKPKMDKFFSKLGFRVPTHANALALKTA